MFGPECSLLAFSNKSSLLSWVNRIDFYPQILYMFGMKVTPEIVRELLDYDPQTGALTWRLRDLKWFKRESDQKRWNDRYAGTPALCCTDRNGHLYGRMFRKNIRAHRVVWAHFYGHWPKQNIDHINGVGSDNRIKNLRDVSQSHNCRNRAQRSDNTHGVPGVYPNRKGWMARINVNGKQIHLGTYPTKAEAIRERLAAEKEHGFSERHGT